LTTRSTVALRSRKRLDQLLLIDLEDVRQSHPRMQRSDLLGIPVASIISPLNHAGHERSRSLLGEVEFLCQFVLGLGPRYQGVR